MVKIARITVWSVDLPLARRHALSGWATAPDAPGIGAAPADGALGDPVAMYTADAP